MLKCLTLTLVLLSLLALKTPAQNLRDDSIKKIAVAAAGKFKLDKASLKSSGKTAAIWRWNTLNSAECCSHNA